MHPCPRCLCRRLLLLVGATLTCVYAFGPQQQGRIAVIPNNNKNNNNNERHSTPLVWTIKAAVADSVASIDRPRQQSKRRRRRRVAAVVIVQQDKEDEVNLVPPVRATSVPLLQLALAGSATTFFADACIHPMDCIKTLQQSANVELGFFQAAAYLWETCGLQGFFQGLLTYAVSDGMGGAIKFSVWETWKKRFGEQKHLIWMGAALAFVAASVVIVPGEFLKQQLQMSRFDSLAQAAEAVYQNKGLGGFFVGYDAVILRDVPHTMLELCLYDVFKRAGSVLGPIMKETSNNDSSSSSPPPPPASSSSSLSQQVHPVLAACLTGCVAGFLTTPMDTIKTKVMVEGSSYDSLLDCLTTTVDTCGWGGVWAGAAARVMWIAPFTMLYLPTYDFLHKRLLERQQQQRHVSKHDEYNDTFHDIDETSKDQ